jgi:hypothetical protein
MSTATAHARMLALPEGHSPAGGRLDALTLVPRGRRMDLRMDFQALQLSGAPVLVELDGQVRERVEGVYLPRRLRFLGVQIERGAELIARLPGVPPDDIGRTLSGPFQWRSPEGECRYAVTSRLEPNGSLLVIAQRVVAELREGAPQAAAYTRAWSPPPPAPARLVPNPRRLRERYGGDPIAVVRDGRVQRRLLFIGSLDTQGTERPQVGAVANFSEEASRWCEPDKTDARDRWAKKGEGTQGMTAAEIAAEARWVIERLQAGQRVLVHCSAGMNRSATICCGVLILMEGLSAEAALERVREYHPWARPDPYHWLALRWLAYTTRL